MADFPRKTAAEGSGAVSPWHQQPTVRAGRRAGPGAFRTPGSRGRERAGPRAAPGGTPSTLTPLSPSRLNRGKGLLRTSFWGYTFPFPLSFLSGADRTKSLPVEGLASLSSEGSTRRTDHVLYTTVRMTTMLASPRKSVVRISVHGKRDFAVMIQLATLRRGDYSVCHPQGPYERETGGDLTAEEASWQLPRGRLGERICFLTSSSFWGPPAFLGKETRSLRGPVEGTACRSLLDF